MILKLNFELVDSIESADAITHSGNFHADEIFATVILARIFEKEGKILHVYRINDFKGNVPPNVIVYDIGGGEYDHHQIGGNGIRKNGIPYSSFGLIWKTFGEKLVTERSVWTTIDKQLVQGIDAIDNGMITKNFDKYTLLSVSSIISSFAPTWNSTMSMNEAFIDAVNFANVIFNNICISAQATFDSKEIIEEAIGKAKNHIMVLDEFVSWQYHLMTSSNEKSKDIWFVVFPSLRVGWNAQTVPVSFGSFEARKTFPLRWSGLLKNDLKEVSGVKTAYFCHKKGFIIGAEDKEGILEMVKIAVESKSESEM